MKLVRENINFEREVDPKIFMGIGRSVKRIFKNTEEASQWCYEFPSICTEGILKEWPYKVLYNRENNLQFTIPKIEGLKIVKWIKNNLLLEENKDYLSLKDAKEIWDKLKEIVKNKSEGK
ncbi:MAG: hypothetical protein PHF86_00750 [Candidatus Nanoarchaeia archaeon]|nr:hypothetical protein [Candidatus Nanoarchaeia archaeon]